MMPKATEYITEPYPGDAPEWITWGREASPNWLASHRAMEVIDEVVTLTETKARLPEVPPTYNHLLVVLGQSRTMLDWEDDFDGEGSPAYKEETWTCARDFLEDNMTRIWKEHKVVIDVPRIRPGPDGSIDIQWHNDKRHLLLNIPEDVTEPATYYGKSAFGHVEGSFTVPWNAQWLMMWLAM